MLEHKLPVIDVPPTERSRFNYYRFHKPLEVMKTQAEAQQQIDTRAITPYSAFLLHDVQNIPVVANSGLALFAQVLTAEGPSYDAARSGVPTDVLKRLQLIAPNIKVASDKNIALLTSYDIPQLCQSIEQIQSLVEFVSGQDIQAILEIPAFGYFKKVLETAPSALRMTNAYMEMIQYLDTDDEAYLVPMQKKDMSIADALLKSGLHTNVQTERIQLSRADAAIMSSVASKFTTDLVNPDGGKPEGSEEEVARILQERAAKVAVSYDKRTGKIRLEYPYNGDAPPRLQRYMKLPEEREVPPSDKLSNAGKGGSVISPGLYAAELLGYATGRNLSFEIADGRAVFKIQKVKKEQVSVFEAHHAVGERAGYREIHEHDATDMLRMWEIDQKNPNANALGKPSSTEYALKRWLMKTKRKAGVHMYAVTAQELPDGTAVEPSKRGEIEGWIRTDETAEERERYVRIMGAAIDESTPITELSSIKRIDPDMPQGLISSARRQILLDMLRNDVQNGLYVGTKANVVHPKRIVTAYINVENDDREDAMRSLEATGFRRAKERVEWIQDDKEAVCDMYVLDWEKLQQIEAEKTKMSVLERLQTLSGTSGLDVLPNTPHENDTAILERIRKQIKLSK